MGASRELAGDGSGMSPGSRRREQLRVARTRARNVDVSAPRRFARFDQRREAAPLTAARNWPRMGPPHQRRIRAVSRRDRASQSTETGWRRAQPGSPAPVTFVQRGGLRRIRVLFVVSPRTRRELCQTARPWRAWDPAPNQRPKTTCASATTGRCARNHRETAPWSQLRRRAAAVKAVVVSADMGAEAFVVVAKLRPASYHLLGPACSTRAAGASSASRYFAVASRSASSFCHQPVTSTSWGFDLLNLKHRPPSAARRMAARCRSSGRETSLIASLRLLGSAGTG